MPYFAQWIDSMNEEGKFRDWNVAIIDGDNNEEPWKLNDNISVGQI